MTSAISSGIIWYELLKPDETITEDLYQQQLINLNNEIVEKILRKAIQADFPWQEIAQRHDTEVWLGTITTCDLLARLDSLWLWLIFINGTYTKRPALGFLGQCEKID